MALIDTEGFGLSNYIGDFVTAGALSTTMTITSDKISISGGIQPNGPLGDNYLFTNGAGTQTSKTMKAPTATFFWGARVYPASGATTGIYFRTPTNTSLVYLTVSTTGVITLFNSAGTQIGQTGANALPASAWSYLEVGAVIATSGGTATVRVNGAVVLAATNVSTPAATGTTVQIVQLGSTSVSTASPQGTSHMYFCDNTGSAPNNTFLGDVRVQTLRPAANSAVQFTPAGAATLAYPPGMTISTSTTTLQPARVYYEALYPSIAGVLNSVQLSSVSSLGTVAVGLYSDTGTGPGSLIASTTGTLSGLTTFTFSSPPTLAPGTRYWLALAFTGTNGQQVYQGTGASVPCVYDGGYTGTLPATASTAPSSQPAPNASNSTFGARLSVTPSTNAQVVGNADLNSANFNSSSAVGQQDTFTVTPPNPTLTTIFGINVKTVASKSDSGTRSMQNVVQSGAANGAGVAASLGTTGLLINDVFATDPNTSAPWTTSAVGAMKVGYTISA